MVRTASRPVAGLPPLFGFGNTTLGLAMFWYYHNSKPRGSANFRPGSNPTTRKATGEGNGGDDNRRRLRGSERSGPKQRKLGGHLALACYFAEGDGQLSCHLLASEHPENAGETSYVLTCTIRVV
jgi:hypothetical protein